MVDYDITKSKKLLEVNNDMVHNYYYLIYGRIYNADKKLMRKFKFVEWFDIFDVMEYFEKDFVTNEDIKEYMNEIACNTAYTYIDGIKDYYDEKGLKEFYDYCNETINNFNRINRGY